MMEHPIDTEPEHLNCHYIAESLGAIKQQLASLVEQVKEKREDIANTNSRVTIMQEAFEARLTNVREMGREELAKVMDSLEKRIRGVEEKSFAITVIAGSSIAAIALVVQIALHFDSKTRSVNYASPQPTAPLKSP
jgi:hypothetical protein